jgi:MobA/VirD2-like, nuclease domain
MIIKGRARGRARQLAHHLLRADQNESIRLYECRGTLACDVEGALIELEARARSGRSVAPLYHASISPDPSHPLTAVQVRQAVDLLEEKLGFHGQPRIVILHRKNDRDHVHVVWSRIATDTGKALPVSWNYRIHEQVSRELEAQFGHPTVRSSQLSRSSEKRRRGRADYELRQEDRSGVQTNIITSELTALWNSCSSGQEFRRKLEEAGYILARGDRRVFVVIDHAGNVHSLARRIQGATTADVRNKLKGVWLEGLPSVAEARSSAHCSNAASILRRRFRRAARELATQRPSYTNASFRAARGYIHQDSAHPFAGAPRGSRQSMIRRRGRSHAYHSMRAALIAEYASRIAQARRHLRPHEIDAAIAALWAERAAALKALILAHSDQRTPEARRVRATRRPRNARLRRLRLRFRRRFSPK